MITLGTCEDCQMREVESNPGQRRKSWAKPTKEP